MPAAASGVPCPPLAALRILVIEDEREITDVLTYNLQREGYETIVAHDGQEGLRKAQTLLPDLIILDLMLPGADRPGSLPASCGPANGRARSRSSSSAPRPRRPTRSSASRSAPTITSPSRSASRCCCSASRRMQRRFDAGGEPLDVIEHLNVRIDRVRHRAYADEPRAGADADGVSPAGVPAAPARPGLHAPPADGRRHRRRRHRAGAHHRRSHQDAAPQARRHAT